MNAGSARGSMRLRYMTAMVVDATGSGMYLPISLLYFHHVTGLPIVQVGTIMSAAALLSLVSNPVAGILVDRLGARAVVIGGYLLRAAGFASYPLVDSPVPMFFAVAVVALGDGSFPPSIQSLVAEIARGADRDRLIAAQRSLRNAGLGLGGLLAAAALGWGSDVAYQAIVLTSGAAFLVTAGLMRTIAAPPPAHDSSARVRRGYRLVFRNRPFLALTLLNVPTAFGYMVLSVSLPVYVTQDLGAPNSIVGVLYAVNTIGIAALQIPVSGYLTRFRRTRAVALGGAVFCMSFLLFEALGLVSSDRALIAGVFAATVLFTVGELLHGATASALVANAAPEYTRGRHLAVYQLSWAVPTALAPAVLTSLLTLSPAVMWLVLAAGVAGSALTLTRLEPRLPRQAVEPHASPPEPSTADGLAKPAALEPSAPGLPGAAPPGGVRR
ncbi:MFS transporter [Micromonospora sp. B11E3]|uniref:MFS transporter n=1 Tax=Micromonospora sp. B11E3 TaxID=3153562 RepID=UPI00325E31A8